MDDLERAIVTWFSDRFGAATPGLVAQASVARAGEREFTDGAGVFVPLHMDAGIAGTNRIALGDGVTALDGPQIRSPELETGALATLHVDPNGILRSIEIWCYSNDYPVGRHPTPFTLVEAEGNYVDARGEL